MSTQGTPQPNPTQSSMKWYKTQGDDGKWYKTQAASPDEAKQKFAKVKKSLAPSNAAAPTQPSAKPGQNFDLLPPMRAPQPGTFAPGHVAEKGLEGVGEMVKGTAMTGAGALMHPFSWEHSLMNQLIVKPFLDENAKTAEAFQRGEYDRAGIHELGQIVPIIGPWIASGLYEGMVTGDPGGAEAKFIGQLGLGEVTGKYAEGAGKRAQTLYERAAKPKDLTKPVGEASRAANLIGTKKMLYNQARSAVAQRLNKIDQGVKAATATGKTVDVTPTLDHAISEARQRAMMLKDQKGLQALTTWRTRMMSDFDPTGKPVARGAKINASQMYNDIKALERDSGWSDATGPRPPAVEQAAKIYRKALGDHLDSLVPGYSQAAREASGLIEARDGYAKQIQDAQMGAGTSIKSVFRAGVPALAAYALMTQMGMDWMTKVAVTSLGIAAGTSALSRTARAAAWSMVDDLMTSKARPAVTKSFKPGQAPPPMGPTAPPGAPTPSPQAIRALAGLPQASPQNAPTAAPNAPLALPQASAAPTAPEALTGRPNAPNPLPSNNLGATAAAAPKMATAPKALPAGPPQVTRVPEGVSGMSPKAKAMLDRIDELTQRMPKSGKDRQDIAREIEDIKKAASSGTSEGERKQITERVQARERQQRHRAKMSAETPGASSTAPTEPTSQIMSPEASMSLREMGYAQLEALPGGKEVANAIRQNAKSLKWDDRAQFVALSEAIEFLKSAALDDTTSRASGSATEEQ